MKIALLMLAAGFLLGLSLSALWVAGESKANLSTTQFELTR